MKKVSWFSVYGFLVSENVLCFQKDILYILTHFHFMCFYRCEIHIQDFRYFIRRIFVMFRCPSFRKCQKKSGFHIVDKNNNCLKCSRDLLVFVLGVLVSPKIKIIETFARFQAGLLSFDDFHRFLLIFIGFHRFLWILPGCLQP